MKYILVRWPESQYLMEHERFHECLLVQDIDGHDEAGSSAYMCPEDLYEDIYSNLEEKKMQLPIKETKQTHAGQYHAYGDSFYEWEIHLEKGAEMSKADVLTYCFDSLSKRKVQSRAEWQMAHRDAGKYFSGYYELYRTSYGYKYVQCLPYTD